VSKHAAPRGAKAERESGVRSLAHARDSAGFGLPLELLAKARDRLRVILWLTLFAAVLSLTVRLSRTLGEPDGFRKEGFGIAYVTVSGGLALLFLAIVRVKRESPSFALRLGLVFEVLLGYLVAIGSTAQEALRYGHAPALTWTAPLMITFPLVVPSPPRTTLFTALLTSTSAWAALAVTASFGLLAPTASTYVEVAVGPVIATAIAVLGSKIVHGLSLDYAAAKRAGSYVLKSRLGVGGMGEVWRAEHQLLARPAAVKLISRDWLGAHPAEAREATARFEREAKATALLRSPHTVELYDYGLTDDGSFFYVMELLDGLDLEFLVKRHGPLPPDRVVHILLQAAASLAEAHENDLIHRDVKPANVYVCQYGLVSDFVKVLDFGLVKAQHASLGGQSDVSRDNLVQGTPAFMSPEQITKERPLGPTSDVYSLGCVAYYLLTGQLPFEGRTVLEMMAHHLTTPAKRASAGAPGAIPPALDELVLACLAKKPEERPRDMLVLSERLEWIADELPWSQARAFAWWREHVPEVAARRTSTTSIAPTNPTLG
jgi:serine/threonine-protein kinase